MVIPPLSTNNQSGEIPKGFISSIQAARQFKKTNGYISLLCRKGLISCVRVEKQWFMDPASLASFFELQDVKREERKLELSYQLSEEYHQKSEIAPPPAPAPAPALKPLPTYEEPVFRSNVVVDFVNRKARASLYAMLIVWLIWSGAEELGVRESALARTSAFARSEYASMMEAVTSGSRLTASALDSTLDSTSALSKSLYARGTALLADGARVSVEIANSLAGGMVSKISLLRGGTVQSVVVATQEAPIRVIKVIETTARASTESVVNNYYYMTKEVSVANLETVSKSYVDEQIQILKNSLSSEVFKFTSTQYPSAPGISQSTANLAVSSRIDRLSTVAIANGTITGSTFSGGSITDSSVSANSLTVSGDTTLSSISASSLTLSGNLTVSGTQTLTGALTIPYFTATSTTDASSIAYRLGIASTSPSQTLSVEGTSSLGNNAIAGYFTATSTTASSFAGGLTSYASTTIGAGTQTTGLTIFGGATTTGNAYFGGNVGVGTTVPARLLHVVSGTNVSARFERTNTSTVANSFGSTLELSNPDTTTNNYTALTFGTYDTSGSGTLQGLGAIKGIATARTSSSVTGDISFLTVNAGTPAEVMRITSAGNLGLGTTSPTYKLSVEGTSSLGNNAIAGYFTSTSTTASSFAGGLTSFASTTIGAGTQTTGLTISGGATTTGNAYFAGNVGIGETSPSVKLQINTTASGATAPDSIRFYETNSGVYGSIARYRGAPVETMRLGINGTSVISIGGAGMTIGSSYVNSSPPSNGLAIEGNVGIGTTSPTYKLSVEGTSSLGNNAIAGYFTSTSTTASSFAGGLTSFASTTIGAGTQTTGLTISGGATTTGNAYFAGNVGVGTTTPTALVDLLGTPTSGPAPLLRITSTGNGYITTDTPTGNWDSGIHIDHGGVTQWTIRNDGQTDSLYFVQGASPGTDASSKLSILANGNVGIGTTTPTNTLAVQGTSYVSGTSFFGGAITATSTLAVSGVSTLTGGFTAFASSTIGAGTQTTGLTISGGATTTGNAYIAGSVSVASTSPWGRLTVDTSSLATGVPAFSVGSSTRQDFVVTQAGYIGIGTTNPADHLQIGDYSNTARNTALSVTGNGSYIQMLRLADTSTSWGFTLENDGSTAVFNIKRHSNSVAGTTALSIVRDTGAVNITGALDVDGVFNAGDVLVESSEDQLSLDFNMKGGGKKGGIVYVDNYSNDWGRGDMYFLNNSTSGASATASLSDTAMIIKNDRRIGIGTTTPWAQLSASSTSATNPAFAVQQNGAGASAIFSGGNVGIGTTTPQRSLDVNGSIRIASGQVLEFGSTAVRNYIASTDDDNYLAFGTLGTEKLRVTSTGNVGIGTTTPWSATKLAVHSSGDYTALSLDNNATGGRSYWLTSTSDTAGIGGGRFGIYDNIASVYRMVVNSSGNVGIGTTSPNALLDIATATNNSTNEYGTLRLGLATAVDGGNKGFYSIGRRNTDGFLSFRGWQSDNSGYRFSTNTSGTDTERLTILNAGNVGIGVTSPSVKLEIDTGSNTSGVRLLGTAETTEVGDIYVGSSGNLVLSTDGTGDTSPYVEVNAEDDEYGLIIRDSSTGNSVFANLYMNDATTDYLNINVGASNSTAGLVLQTGGNVGIGTTTPASLFSVAGAGYFTGALGVGTNNANGSNFRIFNASTPYMQVGDGTRLVNFGIDTADTTNSAFLNSSNGIKFLTNSGVTQAMTILTAGNVGIGTTTPSTRLNVNFTSSEPSLTYHADNGVSFDNASNQELVFGYQPSGSFASWMQVRTWANSAGVLALNPLGGNVGIGTSSPATLMHLQAASGSNVITFGTNNYSNTYRAKILHEESYDSSVAGIPLAIEVENNSTYYKSAYFGHGQNATVPGFKTYYTTILAATSGNVGIGTTSPKAQLEIGGTAAASGPTLGAGTGVLGIGSWDHKYGTYVGVSGNGDTWFQSQRNDGNTATYNLLFNPSGGNVGIGTTTPQSKLSVVSGTNGVLNFPSGNWASQIYNQDDAATSGGLVVGNRWYAVASAVLDVGSLYGTGSAWESFFTVRGNGNVGIGTTTPSYKLQLGNSYNNTLGLVSNDSVGPGLTIKNIGSGGHEYHFLSGGSGAAIGAGALGIYDGTDSAYRLVIAPTSGFIGVGSTTVPLKVLDIGMNNVTGENIYQRFTTNGMSASESILTEYYSSGVTVGKVGMEYDGTSVDYVFQDLYNSGVQNNEVMRIKGTGNVGIGSSTPNAKLVVQTGSPGSFATYADADEAVFAGSGNTGISIISPDANNSEIVFGNPSATNDIGAQIIHNYDAAKLMIYEYAPSGRISLGVGVNDMLNITSTGAVGIGTTTPDNKLTLVGGDTAAVFGVTNTAVNKKVFEIGQALIGGASVPYIANRRVSGDANGDLNFYVNGDSVTGTPTLKLQYNGLVGIGATPDSNTGHLIENTGSGESATSTTFRGASSQALVAIYGSGAALYSSNTAAATMRLGKNNGTGRSINASGTINASGADFAEYFYQAVQGDLQPEDLVCVNEAGKVRKCTVGESPIGVVSTKPAFVGNDLYDSAHPENTAVVGLVGQVPLRVNLEGGDIAVGDRLAPSSVSGVAMKATTTSYTVGRALTAYTAGMSSSTVVAFIEPEFSFIGISLSAPVATTTATALADTGVFASASESFRNGIRSLGDAVVTLYETAIYATTGIFEKVFARKVQTDELCVGSVCVTEEQFMAMVEASQGSNQDESPQGEGEETDTTAPVITLLGANPAVIAVGDAYVDLGATLFDLGSPNVGINVFVDGGATTTIESISIDTSLAGSHTILYSATDEAGNTGTATRTVTVEASAPAPEPESEPEPQP